MHAHIALFLGVLALWYTDVCAMPGGKGQKSSFRKSVRSTQPAGQGIGARDVRAFQQKIQKRHFSKMSSHFQVEPLVSTDEELQAQIQSLPKETSYHLCFIWVRGGKRKGVFPKALIGGKEELNATFQKRLTQLLGLIQETQTHVHLLACPHTLNDNPYVAEWKKTYAKNFHIHDTDDAQEKAKAFVSENLHGKLEALFAHRDGGNPAMYSDIMRWMPPLWAQVEGAQQIQQWTYTDVDWFSHCSNATYLRAILWWQPSDPSSHVFKLGKGTDMTKTFLWGARTQNDRGFSINDVMPFRLSGNSATPAYSLLIQNFLEAIPARGIQITYKLWQQKHPHRKQSLDTTVQTTGPKFLTPLLSKRLQPDFYVSVPTFFAGSWLIR